MFNSKNGFFVRWGRNKDDNPEMSPFGPEIVDMEISTVCHGLGKPCAFCYKANTEVGKHMTIDTFKQIFSKLPKNVTQIAFGIGDCGEDAGKFTGNPDMWEIFKHCRKNNVIPKVTINGYRLTKNVALQLKELCGAVAVSRYSPKDVCYNAVELLSSVGLKQVNIHQLAADFTYDSCLELMDDMENDGRLKGLNAVVFLALKQKGRGKAFQGMGFDKYKTLVNTALDRNLRIGFDSCSANSFLEAVQERRGYSLLERMAEPCESGLFSAYINVEGKYFPCSFTEGEKGIKGIDLLKIKDFMKEVWYAPSVISWRKRLIGNCRSCPIFNVIK
jgi:hypothetical protein